MSVTTTADEKLKSAREHIRSAVSDLGNIVIEKCWGSDDFTDIAQKRIKDIFIKLLDIRNEL